MTGLVNYDEGRRRIQLARSHDEIADIRDKAQALTHYARQAKDSELLAWVSEIKVRAERRAGELIAEQQRNGRLAKPGANQHTTRSSHGASTSTLEKEGITHSDSSRWQRMANIDEREFEKIVATAKDQIGEVTTAFILREAAAASVRTTKQQPAAIARPAPVPVQNRHDRDGQLARFYVVVRGCEAIIELGMSPGSWINDTPPELRAAILPAVLPAHKWLTELLERCK